jgi:arabinan endo-1,5-alpha-L-arabinosidase
MIIWGIGWALSGCGDPEVVSPESSYAADVDKRKDPSARGHVSPATPPGANGETATPVVPSSLGSEAAVAPPTQTEAAQPPQPDPTEAAPPPQPDPTEAAPPPPPPCTTRITYGSGWLKPEGHWANYDVAKGKVTWNGYCALNEAGNAYATLSNGWRPHFKGRSCVIALDYSASCDMPQRCTTRVAYGPSWTPGPNHPTHHDDAAGVITWDGTCRPNGRDASWALLSNGWKPGFRGVNGCDLSFRHTQCRGLFANPVVARDCPDPAVLKDGTIYYMVCTPGPHYPIRSSTDLVHWKHRGLVFTNATRPAWAKSDFWAPEMHKVGARYVVYFSARQRSNNGFGIGAAWADKPTGPYHDLGRPLLAPPAPGAIDAHYFRSSKGQHYLLWKVENNPIGKQTPIRIQQLAPDGLGLVGAPRTLISNTLAWEGALVEGPWMIERGGYYYLFYSANGYADPRYSVGVARSRSPLGPFQKGSRILSGRGAWAAPGHGAVVRGPSGAWVHIYHAWRAGQIMKPPGRLVLIDRLQWANDWPLMRSAPSSRSQPLP